MAMSRWALALAIWAFLRICSTLSIPMFSMVPALSRKFWMLKFTSSMPSLAMSGMTFSDTFLATPCRSCTISLRPTEPTISRMLPSSTWVTMAISWLRSMLSRLSAAFSRSLGSEDIFTLATPSTMTLINSLVGTASEVLTSTVSTCRESTSTLSRKGIRQPALPIRMRRRPMPEMI